MKINDTYDAHETRLRQIIDKLTVGDAPARGELAQALSALTGAHVEELTIEKQKARTPGPVMFGTTPAQALEILYREPDGRRLIECALRADPKRTSVELNYLGAHRIAGEASVRRAVETGEGHQKQLFG